VSVWFLSSCLLFDVMFLWCIISTWKPSWNSVFKSPFHAVIKLLSFTDLALDYCLLGFILPNNLFYWKCCMGKCVFMMQNLFCPAKDEVCANKRSALNILGLKNLVGWCFRVADFWWVSCDIRNRLPYFLSCNIDILAFFVLVCFVLYWRLSLNPCHISIHNWCAHVLETFSLKYLRNYFYSYCCFHWWCSDL
jgi:hypothetical protein